MSSAEIPDKARSDPSGDLARLNNSPHALASWQNAQQCLLNGRHALGLASYRSLTQQFPGVAQLWVEMGMTAAADLDFSLADRTFQRAMELGSTDASLLVSLGQQYHRLRRLDQVRACFERAATAEPSSVHAQLSLAAWYERERRLDRAWECAQACLALHPKDERTLYFLAFLLHGKGLNSEAETALRDLLQSDLRDPDVKASASHLLGVVLDARGQYPDAIRWLGQAKTQMCQLTDPTALQLSYDRMDQARRELLADLTPETLRRWREKAGGAPGSHRMAFLGGPPMSGTALIEQVLGNHSEILLVDESEAFAQELLTALHPPAPARGLTLKSLNALPPTARSQMIDRYIKSLLRETDKQPGGKLLVDKNPSLTASLHIWLRLFPQLKVIIALRDPRDVVISCYFQNLPLTAANSNFLSLERTAKYYADCMDVWLRLRELGGFDWIETRYENAVANLEAEGQRVTGFLGLPWQRAQASLDESACRKFIFAPTYNEATQPVAGRWKNYADALAPLHESLEKYCRALGYE